MPLARRAGSEGGPLRDRSAGTSTQATQSVLEQFGERWIFNISHSCFSIKYAITSGGRRTQFSYLSKSRDTGAANILK